MKMFEAITATDHSEKKNFNFSSERTVLLVAFWSKMQIDDSAAHHQKRQSNVRW